MKDKEKMLIEKYKTENVDKPVKFSHYALSSYQLLSDSQFELIAKNILEPDVKDTLGLKIRCPLCGMETE